MFFLSNSNTIRVLFRSMAVIFTLLFGVLFAPPLIAQDHIDPTITGAIGPTDVSGQNQGSRQFRAAVSLLAQENFSGAYQLARGFSNSAERRTVQWAAIYFGGGEVEYASVRRFSADAPLFASERLYKSRIEQALVTSNAAKDEVIGTLGGVMPQTIDGQIALALAYLADGQRARAIRIARQIWTTNFLAREQETLIEQKFGRLLSREDHWKRTVYLLMSDRAKGAERILSYLSPAQKTLVAARIAVARKQSDADRLLDRVDPAYRDHPLFFFSRAQYARRAGNYKFALEMLDRATGPLPSPSQWWYERRYLARKLLEAGDARSAYRAADGFTEGPQGRLVDANFHAGWIALSFLGDPQTAVRHFEKMRAMSTLSSTITQANYWLGRARGKLGDTEGARQAFAVAAQYHMTYYGQLARYRLGDTEVEMRSLPVTGGSEPQFNSRELVIGVKLLAANGQAKMAETLLGRLLYQLTDPGEMLLAARLAQTINAHQLAILMADIANRKGVALDVFNYPRDGIPRGARLADIDLAAIYAVARQESRFDVDAISSAGARGLMQLMPATAEETARRLGVNYSPDRLTSDPAYNALLGSTYLGAQLSRYEGSLILAAGAYNAGPGNVNKWIAAFGDPKNGSVDPVVWIEQIPFVETRKYVQRVLANYMFYRARLGVEDMTIAQILRRIPSS